MSASLEDLSGVEPPQVTAPLPGVKRAIGLQIAGVVLAAAVLFWLWRQFPLSEWIATAQRTVAGMGWWGGIAHPLLYALANLLLLPGGVLAIGSGLFFGLWWGFALSLLGNVLGAAIAFTAGRKLGRRWVEKRFAGQSRWAALDEAISREGWKIIFLSQVHPLFPTSLLNYFYGVTRVPFRVCMLWIMLGQAPGLFLYAYLGTLAQLGLRLVRGQTHPTVGEYVLWLGGLALTVAVLMALGRIALRVLAEVEAAGASTVEDKGGGSTKDL